MMSLDALVSFYRKQDIKIQLMIYQKEPCMDARLFLRWLRLPSIGLNGWIYSYRNASIGSKRAALRAG